MSEKFCNFMQEVRINMMGMMMVKVMPKWVVRLLSGTGILHLMTKYFKHARRSLSEVLDELTDDADFKAVLSYSWGDYGKTAIGGDLLSTRIILLLIVCADQIAVCKINKDISLTL